MCPEQMKSRLQTLKPCWQPGSGLRQGMRLWPHRQQWVFPESTFPLGADPASEGTGNQQWWGRSAATASTIDQSWEAPSWPPTQRERVFLMWITAVSVPVGWGWIAGGEGPACDSLHMLLAPLCGQVILCGPPFSEHSFSLLYSGLDLGSSLHWQWPSCHFHLIPGFPVGTSSKEPACQCRRHKRHGLDPWIGKIPWRRAWQPTPVFLPREFHGQRSLASYSPRNREESDTIEVI